MSKRVKITFVLISLMLQMAAGDNIRVDVEQDVHESGCSCCGDSASGALKGSCVTPEGIIMNGGTWDNGCIIYTCHEGILSTDQFTYPEGFQKVSDGCFLPVWLVRNWNDSRQYCLDLGADLASMPSDIEEMQTFIAKQFGPTATVWLGGHLQDGVWSYVIDGTPVDESHWFATHPIDFGGDCLSMNRKPDTPNGIGSCSNLDCDQSFYDFICEMN